MLGQALGRTSRTRLRTATAEVFGGWIHAAATRLQAAGVDPERARELATMLVAAVEGGFMLSRAAQSPEPMQTDGRLMRQLVDTALGGSPAASHRSSAGKVE